MRAFLAVLLVACASPLAAQPSRVLDDFEALAGWRALPAEGVEMEISQGNGRQGQGLRIDFDFARGAGYAIARKAFDLDFPEDYELSFWLRAEAPANNLEVKLVDASGDNVWWVNRRGYEFPREWRKIRIKKRHLEFAWGPTQDRVLRHAAALEIVVTAGTGGKGTVWVDDLTFTPLAAEAAPLARAAASASSSAPGHGPELATDGDPSTAWRVAPGPADGRAWLTLDLLARRELGGLVIDWLDDAPWRFEVELSEDGTAWQRAYSTLAGGGPRSFLYLPEAEARLVRIVVPGEAAPQHGLREVSLYPPTFGSSPSAFFEAVARQSPRGSYPRSLAGEQVYWTVVGVDGDAHEGLLSEDGMLETDKASFSIEPFVWIGGQEDGRLVGWGDVESTPSLAEGYLPIPTVTWKHPQVSLAVIAFGAGEPGRSRLYARYRVGNPGAQPLTATLFLALRPFQVNPPAQFLNTPGGFAPIEHLTFDGRTVTVNRGPRVVPLTRPSAFGAVPFDSEPLASWLARGTVPPVRAVEDRLRFASGALSYRLTLRPGEARDVDLAIPFGSAPVPETSFDDQLAATAAAWRAKLGRVTVTVPKAAQALPDTLRTALAHMLVNRDGPAIQPGSRSYERSWIRDGALTSSALLRLGHEREVAEFLAWYAPYQYESGKVPCCVDARGADPVPENDSHGELIYLAAEHFRFTSDRELATRLWPHVAAAVRYMDELRGQRRTEAFRQGDQRLFFGLLPESISHEGYSAKPMHSYWDDFWALQGYEDAVFLARALGQEAEAAALRSERARSFAATSTLRSPRPWRTTASTTCRARPSWGTSTPPRPPSPSTRRASWRGFRGRRSRPPSSATGGSSSARRDGARAWDGYTPYELRNVGAFVRLGWRERARELLEFFFATRRPDGLEPVARGGVPRARASPVFSATCRTPGWARTSSARPSTSSPTSVRATARWCSPPASPRRGSRKRTAWGSPACARRTAC